MTYKSHKKGKWWCRKEWIFVKVFTAFPFHGPCERLKLKESFFYSYPLFEFLWLKSKISFSIDIFSSLSLSGVNLSNFFLLCDYFFYPFSITNKKKTQTEKGEVCEIIYFFLSA